MPLRSKVKTRFQALAASSIALASACLIIVAQVAPTPPTVGERAVAGPQPPVLVPPLLDKAAGKPHAIRVFLKTQRLHLLIDGQLAIDSPVTTGRKDLSTPSGKFVVEGKEAVRNQDSYGSLVDSRGEVVLPGVYRHRDPVPADLRFDPEPLNHVIRLKDQKFTIHAGAVSALPTSEGSIILPPEIAKLVFGKVSPGCPIEIIEK